MYYALAILSLAFLIVVHEGGHYFVARWCKMRIDRFSIGFGPGILKRVSKKTGTIFQLAPIPFGGFVEIRGMNIAEEVDPDDRFAYPNRPAWQRFITIFAGPATNYISAIVLAFGVFTCQGVRSDYRFFGVGSVQSSYDAAGKLESGDRILAVDHKPILADGEYTAPDGTHYKADEKDSLRGRVNRTFEDVTLTILRDGKKFDVTVHPRYAVDPIGILGLERDSTPCIGDNTVGWLKGYMPKLVTGCPGLYRPYRLLGISPSLDADFVHVGIFESAKQAVVFPVLQTKVIASGLYEIIAGREKADPGGPKRIFDEFSKAWKVSARSGLELLMMLSVYLGLFNLFPLPALDGGRLVFLGYEMVTRRRANPKIEAMVHMSGIMVLGIVMVLVTLRDCHVF